MYYAAKAGLDMFSEVIHSEQPIHHPKHPVRIFSIAPGVVDTGMQKQIPEIPKKNFAGKQRFVRMKAEACSRRRMKQPKPSCGLSHSRKTIRRHVWV